MSLPTIPPCQDPEFVVSHIRTQILKWERTCSLIRGQIASAENLDLLHLARAYEQALLYAQDKIATLANLGA